MLNLYFTASRNRASECFVSFRGPVGHVKTYQAGGVTSDPLLLGKIRLITLIRSTSTSIDYP